ncbi:hypothetical protein N7448_010297 [Penicillium atrosanguineum]|uniref:Extracellular membrane protein CFEM domain-containing protein n=1 Tax=Penicillium atrosanguineum TaxID=1132637 RepID=A0A9W9PNI3_9EURO|nr:White collar 1 protein [Penicillium atrosanguineum]KAJ5118589.1 hypothetical protein N7526_010226 [Penicillium atrosanguineum]KAJ5119628.1 hypothetical protein N7448_010297 [Penicillium atrosanguineum]KAJ5296629.1 White collar 1 protein [Penicillium atrosanguineum]KAJ5299392.1 hypothetical protein N7476_010949 [Penicillium atrosanguineum]
MPSFKHLLLPITLLLASTTASTCPKNWLENTPPDGNSKCCYGNMVIDDTDAFCCVNDMTPSEETSDSTTTTDDYDSWSTAGDCFTKIPFTASDYSEQVSSASSKVLATRTIMVNEATSTTASSSSASSTSSNASSSSAASTSSDASSRPTASTTTNAAMPIATAQEMVVGAAVIVGIFVL